MDIDYKSLIENIFDGLYLVDKNRSIIYWNHVAETITGYPADEVIGRRCRDNILVHVDRYGKNLCREGCPVDATIKDGRFRDAEVYLKHKDGHRVPVWVRTAPLHDTAGTIITSSPSFQFTGVATLCFNVSCNESISRRISSKLRPVLIG